MQWGGGDAQAGDPHAPGCRDSTAGPLQRDGPCVVRRQRRRHPAPLKTDERRILSTRGYLWAGWEGGDKERAPRGQSQWEARPQPPCPSLLGPFLDATEIGSMPCACISPMQAGRSRLNHCVSRATAGSDKICEWQVPCHTSSLHIASRDWCHKCGGVGLEVPLGRTPVRGASASSAVPVSLAHCLAVAALKVPSTLPALSLPSSRPVRRASALFPQAPGSPCRPVRSSGLLYLPPGPHQTTGCLPPGPHPFLPPAHVTPWQMLLTPPPTAGSCPSSISAPPPTWCTAPARS